MNNALAIYRDTPTQNANGSFACPSCGCCLTLHQPDPELADRLLATCDDCKSWYVTNPTTTGLRPIRQLNDRRSRD
jgi:hypothetical protein